MVSTIQVFGIASMFLIQFFVKKIKVEYVEGLGGLKNSQIPLNCCMAFKSMAVFKCMLDMK